MSRHIQVHTYPRQVTWARLAPWGRTNSHKDVFVPVDSHVKSQHGRQDRWSETAEHFLTPPTAQSPSATPGLLGSPPGGVLQTRRLLLSPPFPDGHTEAQADVKDLPNPTAWSAEAPELVRHSPTIQWAFRLCQALCLPPRSHRPPGLFFPLLDTFQMVTRRAPSVDSGLCLRTEEKTPLSPKQCPCHSG